MASTTEIAASICRISVFVPEINLEFSHFLVRDEEPLLFHAGFVHTGPRTSEETFQLTNIQPLPLVTAR